MVVLPHVGEELLHTLHYKISQEKVNLETKYLQNWHIIPPDVLR